jgi:hypothetical protein
MNKNIVIMELKEQIIDLKSDRRSELTSYEYKKCEKKGTYTFSNWSAKKLKAQHERKL